MNFYMKQHNFWLSLAIAMAANSMSAQNIIKGAGTDEKFANTTVVYKDSATNDQAILAQLNDSNLGIGDVVRITTPPPPAKIAAPITVKKAAVINTANNSPKVLPKPVVAQTNVNLVASTDNPSLMLASIQTKGNTPDPVRSTNTRKVVVPRITPALVENDRETTRTITTKTVAKSAKSGKSVRSEKSARKSNKSSAAHRTTARKYKPRGKQQYGCYHF
jgi:hypothetical protein